MGIESKYIEAVAALENSEWRRGLQGLRQCSQPFPISTLLRRPELAHATAWAAFHSGIAINREFVRLLGNQPPADERDWPTLLADQIFGMALDLVRLGTETQQWDAVCRFLSIAMQLPAGTIAREQLLYAVLRHCLDTILARQTGALARLEDARSNERNPRPPWPRCPALLRQVLGSENPFDVPARVIIAAAQIDAYPQLSERLLEHVLGKAEWPVLIFLDGNFLVSAWPEIDALISDSRRVQRLGPSGRDWLERAARCDLEEDAPGEFADEDGEDEV